MSTSDILHVAIVDDDESLCRSLGRLLDASDIRSLTYLSAEAFLADPQHLLFDCILLDIQFYGMSGIELQRKLATEACRAPIIFITAHDDAEVRRQALDTGCAAFFQKTEAGSFVIDAIRRVVTSPSSDATPARQLN